MTNYRIDRIGLGSEHIDPQKRGRGVNLKFVIIKNIIEHNRVTERAST